MENKNKIAQLYILGITGGIGSGKSEVLRLLSEQPDTCIVESDKLAHRLMEPGHTCYRKIVEAFGSEILAEDVAFLMELEPDLVVIDAFRPEEGTEFESFPKGDRKQQENLVKLVRKIFPDIRILTHL